MYTSLLISLLAAFIAMLGKQWLNRYLRHAGGSTIERCGDRQRKCDGLEKWPFHLFVESLPVMLQLSLLLLACGLCRRMWSVNTFVSYILITLTVLGILFYLAIVIAVTSSYECPFQTPASAALRSLWKKIWFHKPLPITRSIVPVGPYALLPSNMLYPSWEKVTRSVVLTAHRFKYTVGGMTLSLNRWVRITFGLYTPAASLEEIREDSRVSPEPNPPSPVMNPLPHRDSCMAHGADNSHNTANPPPHNSDSLCHNSDPPHHDPDPIRHNSDRSSQDTPTLTPGNIGPWLTWEDLNALQKTNAKDIRCVSWILRNITDPEALDAAIRFAGTIRWFEDGVNIEPPYNAIVSIFHTCLDSTGTVYPGLLGRAYHSARAMLWIHIRALGVSEEFACSFPLPYIKHETHYYCDLNSLLKMFDDIRAPQIFACASTPTEFNTHTHMQWALHALLHFCWAKQGDPDAFSVVAFHRIPCIPWNAIPLDAALNLFLVWSILLGSPIEGEVLKIQDKTYAIPDFCFV